MFFKAVAELKYTWLVCGWQGRVINLAKNQVYIMSELDLMYIDLGMMILTADGCSEQAFQLWFLFFWRCSAIATWTRGLWLAPIGCAC